MRSLQIGLHRRRKYPEENENRHPALISPLTPLFSNSYSAMQIAGGSRSMHRRFFLASTSLAALTCAMVVSAQTSTETYTYDALGRLVRVVTTGGANNAETQSICYDPAGNRTAYVSNESAGATGCEAATQTPTPAPSPSNNPPIAPNRTLGILCSQTSTLNLLSTATDPDGDFPLSLRSISKTSAGPASVLQQQSGGTVMFDGGYSSGTTRFRYTIADSEGLTASGNITVTTGSCAGGAN